MTVRLFSLILSLTGLAAFGGYVLRGDPFVQAVWLLLATFVICIILFWKPQSVKEFFAYALGEAIAASVWRIIGGLLRLLFH